jgi:hypothetical protein
MSPRGEAGHGRQRVTGPAPRQQGGAVPMTPDSFTRRQVHTWNLNSLYRPIQASPRGPENRKEVPYS